MKGLTRFVCVGMFSISASPTLAKGETRASAMAPAKETRSVSLTAHATVKGLSALDEALAEPVPLPERQELVLQRGHNEKAKVVSCYDWLELRNNGYKAVTTYDLSMQSFFKDRCEEIEYLKKAVPAKVSHLDGFRLSVDSLAELPAAMEPSPSRSPKASPEGSWKDIAPNSQVKVIDPHQVEITGEGMTSRILLKARGDFNRDGIEDLLLFMLSSVTEHTYRAYNHVILTRKEKGGRLIVVK